MSRMGYVVHSLMCRKYKRNKATIKRKILKQIFDLEVKKFGWNGVVVGGEHRLLHCRIVRRLQFV